MSGFTRTLLIAAAVFGALTPESVRGQPGRPGHALISLHWDGGSAGVPLTVGVRFRLDTGWHIFWRNAGGSGSPPTIKWAPVLDLRMGDIQWPVPRRIRVDTIVSYGYDGEVMFLVPATRGNTASGALTLAATVDFVICRDVCVGETATATLALPAANAMPARSADAGLFEQARARLPRSAPPTWTVSARVSAAEITLRIAAPAPPRAPSFFPFVNALIDDAAPQRAETDGSGALTLHLVKSQYFIRAPATFEGVLLGADGRAFTIKAPLGDR